jgi:hypothetical protein
MQNVTFVVRNEGDTDHEFVLGDETYQAMHEEDTAEGGEHMMGMDSPGEIEELTWRFDGPERSFTDATSLATTTAAWSERSRSVALTGDMGAGTLGLRPPS